MSNSPTVENITIAGNGNNWNSIYTGASSIGRITVGGGAKTVGLGGFIQGGSHGPLSSLVTTARLPIKFFSRLLSQLKAKLSSQTPNKFQQDLLFAIRGRGAGQYGVVAEDVLNSYSVPRTMVAGTLELSTAGRTDADKDISWLTQTCTQVSHALRKNCLAAYAWLLLF